MTPGYECPRARVLDRAVRVIWPLALLRQIKDHYRLFRDKVGYEILRTTETLNKHRFNRILVASIRFS
jgi:hypothetical protein